MSDRLAFSLPVLKRAMGMAAMTLLALACPWAIAESQSRDAFEATGDHATALTELDRHVIADLAQHGLQMSPPASDEVFLRRAYVDVLGALPQADDVSTFLVDARADKRARRIETLLDDPRFADRWSNKWCDLLRVKAEFPINLWPNGVQAYHRWVHEAITSNTRYNVFVRELLTSSGSNFRVPPVNFYRAVQGREPANLASVAALTFMGSRIETWQADRRRGAEALFSRVTYKPTAEWKEEIILSNPAIYEPLEAMLPDGTRVTVAAGDDPRSAFANWLIRDENPWFARAAVNRVWCWLLGRGIVHEPDDLRPDNPPVNPALLRYLESEFKRSGYDLKHIYRLILNSRTYQQSSIPASSTDFANAEKHFGCYIVRRMDAEVLVDALDGLFGGAEGYVSPIPEPFTHLPPYLGAMELADGSISSTFLELFGRPSRDTGLESERNNAMTGSQRMYLLNSSHMQKKVERSNAVKNWLQHARNDDAKLIESIYVGVLCRQPSTDEMRTAKQYIKARPEGRQAAANDLTWAMINSREFLYRH